MVSYAYQSLFYKAHQKKDILIVDAEATVTTSSGQAPTVSGATIEIHTADIESESFQLDESICSEDNLKFGLCESAKVEFTIRNKADIPNLKSSDYGDLLNIYLYFNGDSDTLFQIGQYVCYKDKYTSNRKLRNIELYDLNFTLNDLDITSWYNQYFSDGNRHQIIFVIADLFNWINKSGTYANDDSSPNIHIEIDPVYTLCNGAFPIGKTIESDTITFGFFMQGLLEFNGAFGHITREGKFKFLVMESYDATPCRTVTDDFRKPPTNYSDDNTWGIGQIDVYGRNNEMKFTQQNTDKKKPSIYVMVDPWVLADREAGDSYTNNAVRTLLITINHYNYNKSETECSGDLCIEVGDRYNVEFTQTSEYDTRNWFRSYVLERHFKGIQSMHDTYTAKGDKKQPLYQITNDNWHIGDSTTATQGQGTGGVANYNDEYNEKFVEVIRNIGYRLLDEPSDVSVVYNKSDGQVEIKWSDPTDISAYSPVPIDWAGTVVVRSEGKPPVHIWDGTILVTSTTRDAYKTTAFVDDTIDSNKRYYYGIFPYHIGLDDSSHPIKYYRFTKVMSVDTARILVAPTLFPIQESAVYGTSVTVGYSLPVLEVGSYEVIKLVAKKNAIPTSISDGDKAIDLTPTPGIIVNTATMTGLDENSHYYFVIFIEDEQGNTASSEPQDCVTGERNEEDFFTDSFNPDLIKDGWDLAVYKGGFADGSTQWAPTHFSSDFLSSYNFLIGNYNRDGIVEDNGILKRANYHHGGSDSIYWIPINRVNGELKGLEWDYCNLRSVGGSYDAIGILIGWVDSNNGWHQSTIAWVERLWSSEWQHGEYTNLSPGNTHIDYIGIYSCDGQPAYKNIKFIVE